MNSGLCYSSHIFSQFATMNTPAIPNRTLMDMITLSPARKSTSNRSDDVHQQSPRRRQKSLAEHMHGSPNSHDRASTTCNMSSGASVSSCVPVLDSSQQLGCMEALRRFDRENLKKGAQACDWRDQLLPENWYQRICYAANFDSKHALDLLQNMNRSHVRLTLNDVPQLLDQTVYPCLTLTTHHDKHVLFVQLAAFAPGTDSSAILDHLAYGITQLVEHHSTAMCDGICLFFYLKGLTEHHLASDKVVQELLGALCTTMPVKIAQVLLVNAPVWLKVKRKLLEEQLIPPTGISFCHKIYWVAEVQLGKFLMPDFAEHLPDATSIGDAPTTSLVLAFVKRRQHAERISQAKMKVQLEQQQLELLGHRHAKIGAEREATTGRVVAQRQAHKVRRQSLSFDQLLRAGPADGDESSVTHCTESHIMPPPPKLEYSLSSHSSSHVRSRPTIDELLSGSKGGLLDYDDDCTSSTLPYDDGCADDDDVSIFVTSMLASVYNPIGTAANHGHRGESD